MTWKPVSSPRVGDTVKFEGAWRTIVMVKPELGRVWFNGRRGFITIQPWETK